jgi:prepilin-type N-terminal cleavage/methylation domain-containing protein
MTGSSHFNLSGFTLIEALIALLVLGVGLAAVARLQADLLVDSRQAKARGEATAIARQHMEHLRFLSLQRSPGLLSLAGTTNQAGSHQVYRIEWQATPTPGMPYAQTVVQVHWTDRSGPHRIQLATLLADPEPVQAGQLLLQKPRLKH